MKRILGVLVLLLPAIATIWFSGCDEPKKADQTQPYHLAATYPFPAPAKHVVAMGHIAAVADGAYGGVVLNVSNLAHIDTVFHGMLNSPFAGASLVALDTINHLVAITSQPGISGDSTNPLYDYTTRTYIGEALPLGIGAYLGLEVIGQRNRATLWGGQNAGVGGGTFWGYRWRRDTDTSQWIADSDPVFSYSIQGPGFGNTNAPEGFAHRGSDSVFALSVEEAGVLFLNDSSGTELSRITVPGAAYDCQWYQDSLLVVAADFIMVIINARDVTHPAMIAQLAIPNSDRMRGVAIDDHWACIMDGYDGIYVVDIASPRNPVYVQLIRLDSPTSVCANNGRLYATDQTAGLLVFTH